MNKTAISFNDLYTFTLIGGALALIYLFLLWHTVSTLARAKRKNLILFISAALRIFLLIFVALVFAGQNLSHFLLIMCGFLLTRMILLKILKNKSFFVTLILSNFKTTSLKSADSMFANTNIENLNIG